MQETQLFNLKDNPDEFLPEHGRTEPLLTNLAKNPAYAAKLAEMQALLLAEMRRLDDPWRFANQPGDDLPPVPVAAKKGKNKKATK